MNLEFIKPQNLGSLLMKSSQSNFNLRLPGSYLVRSYLITTVPINLKSLRSVLAEITCELYFFLKNNKLTFHLFGIPEQHNHQD